MDVRYPVPRRLPAARTRGSRVLGGLQLGEILPAPGIAAGATGTIGISGVGGVAVGTALALGASGVVAVSGVGGIAAGAALVAGTSGTVTTSGTGGDAAAGASVDGAAGTIAISGLGGLATGDSASGVAEGATGTIVISGVGGEAQSSETASAETDPRAYPNLRFKGLRKTKLRVEVPPPTLVEPDPVAELVVVSRGDANTGVIARLLAPLAPPSAPAQTPQVLRPAVKKALAGEAFGARGAARVRRPDTTAEDVVRLLARIDALLAANAWLKAAQAATQAAHRIQLSELRAEHERAMSEQAALHLQDLMRLDKELQRQRNESRARALVQQLLEQN